MHFRKTSIIQLDLDECANLIFNDIWQQSERTRQMSIIFALTYGAAAAPKEIQTLSKSSFAELNDSKTMAPEQGARVKLSGFVERCVDIPRDLFDLLLEQSERAKKWENDLLFNTNKGNVIHNDTMSSDFEVRRKTLGLPAAARISDLRWAGLRHMYEDGMPLPAILQSLDLRGATMLNNIKQALNLS